MTAILTITLNPTVDLSITADHVAPERKLRCSNPLTDPGGGGINVSRAISAMGGHSTAFVALGGPTGDKVMHLLSEQGIGLQPFPAPGETRQSLTVTDQRTGERYDYRRRSSIGPTGTYVSGKATDVRTAELWNAAEASPWWNACADIASCSA